MRLFVGLELDETVRGAAAAVAARLESRMADLAGDFKARWIPGSNLHITIWFFGEVSDEAAAILFEQLRAYWAFRPSARIRGCARFRDQVRLRSCGSRHGRGRRHGAAHAQPTGSLR